MTRKLIDPDFCRFTEDEKGALRRDVERRSRYDYLVSYLEDRGRYRLESERELDNGKREAIYAHSAGGLATFTIDSGIVTGVQFTEGLAGWAGESGEEGPTSEMSQTLSVTMGAGRSERRALEEIDEQFYPFFYAEERCDSGIKRYYLLYPKCMLEVVSNDDGRIKNYQVLAVKKALELFT